MDFQNCVLTFYYLVPVCLIASGIVHGQLEMVEDNYSDEISQQMLKRGSSYSTYDPEYDWRKLGTNKMDEDTLISLLKRVGVFKGADGYRRLLRNKQQIIPFYSYGSDMSAFRSMPRHSGNRRFRQPYRYTPWDMSGRMSSSNRLLRRPVYDSFTK